jgi:hypothetical protein
VNREEEQKRPRQRGGDYDRDEWERTHREEIDTYLPCLGFSNHLDANGRHQLTRDLAAVTLSHLKLHMMLMREINHLVILAIMIRGHIPERHSKQFQKDQELNLKIATDRTYTPLKLNVHMNNVLILLKTIHHSLLLPP